MFDLTLFWNTRRSDKNGRFSAVPIFCVVDFCDVVPDAAALGDVLKTDSFFIRPRLCYDVEWFTGGFAWRTLIASMVEENNNTLSLGGTTYS